MFVKFDDRQLKQLREFLSYAGLPSVGTLDAPDIIRAVGVLYADATKWRARVMGHDDTAAASLGHRLAQEAGVESPLVADARRRAGEAGSLALGHGSADDNPLVEHARQMAARAEGGAQ